MRLLQLQDDGDVSLFEFTGNKIPPYAILSHTWGADNEEVTFQDIKNSSSKNKASYHKIYFCGKQAALDGLQYFWVDTCCIDKSSSQELSEAINSMFRWYKNAEKCYVYLSDVSDSTSIRDGECIKRWKPALERSRWFTRGWTLQELISPDSVEFFSMEGTCLGNKQSLEQTLHEITGIAVEALRGGHLSQFNTDELFSWAAKRKTSREEDAAYCLLGIFDVFMPLLYSEGRKKAFARLEEQIRKDSVTEKFSLKEEQKRLLLDSLRFNQIHIRQTTVKNAHTKTCKWLLEDSKYLDWLDAAKLSKHHGLLWIKGKPGTGKSTLMKFALAHAHNTIRNGIVISFFFNARGEDLEKSTTGTYQSLLLQLLEGFPALQSVFNSLGHIASSISTKHQWSVESLQTLLEQSIQKLGESSVVCFIDALDECEEQQVREMIQFFERIGQLIASTGIRFRTCFSSRHYPYITIQKGLGLVLEGQEGHVQDIHYYLESELKIGQSIIAQQIRNELREKASGVFMWVVLVVSILNKEHDRGRMYALRRRLQEIPSDLDRLFRDILTRDLHNRDELVLCIQWVLFAKQPLSPVQLYFAVLSGVEPEAMLTWDPSEITEDVIKRFILDSSKGLTEITTSGFQKQKVQFIHESVRDFLVKENGLSIIWPELGSNLKGQSHERLKQCCVTHISMDVLTPLKVPESLPEASSPQAAGLRKSAIHAFPFLEYAVQNVLHHADVAEGSGISQTQFVPSFPLPRWIKLSNLLQTDEKRRRKDNVSLLYVLAEHNMSNLVKFFPSIASYLKVEEEQHGAPLFTAFSNGSKAVVRVFVQALAAENPTGGRYQELYGQYYEDKFVQRVIGEHFSYLKERGVISYLAELGDETLFAILLKTKVSVIDSRDQYGRTPLWWAAQNGHEAIVKLLLDTGKVNINSKDHYGRTPLLWATERGYNEIVKLLLDTGKVNVDERDYYRRTPLWWAAQNGHEAMVRLLLDTGKVDVDAKDSQYRQTPLWWAIQNGNEAIVKLLLDTGKIKINSKYQYGRKPLLWTIGKGHIDIFKLLLNTGKVDINEKDNYGRTPLWWAAHNGHEAMVRLLLDTGKVDVDAKDSQYGRTPLWCATRNTHEVIIKLLLDTGKVNVDAKDNHYGRTPLWFATKKIREVIVKLLLDTCKVDVDAKDSHYGRTPLWWAARNGHEAIVRLLLKTGKVDVDAKDSQHGQTPLSWAAQNGHEAIIKLLLETGKINIDSKDRYGRTPLLWATEKGNNDIFKLLFNTGKVDVNAKDDYGRTPLLWATKNGDEAVVKLLQSYVRRS
jgi:ankyrin repeat protein